MKDRNTSPCTLVLDNDLVPGNHFDKYRSKNRIHQLLLKHFLQAASALLQQASPTTVLEVGCGPGDLAAHLLPTVHPRKIEYLGIDLSEQEVETARRRYPNLRFEVASALGLPQGDTSFDLVIACEVLEHIDDPSQALAEIFRVSNRFALISVPWEPVWRWLNCVRGQYLHDLGNTPGHLQHFNRRKIRRLVRQRFRIVDERHPFPWTMLLAEKAG